MINALDLLLQAYINILNTPHKTRKEQQLMGNLYAQICLFGGQPYRIKCEKAKVLYNRASTVQSISQVTGFAVATTAEPEKKNPVKQPENPPLPLKQNEVVAEAKKRGPKPKVKE